MVSQVTFDERRLLVIDLDGSLIGGPPAGHQKFRKALQPVRDSTILVYVSGRSLAEQLETIEQEQLLLPDYIVSNVGTEIHRMPGEHPLDEWYRYIQAGFDRQAIVAFFAGQAAAPGNPQQLELQPEERQTPLKVSYFFRRGQTQAVRPVAATAL